MQSWPAKDPNEVLDYQLDWSDDTSSRLEVGESIVTSTWVVVSGDVVIDSSSQASGVTTVWLSGGTDGMPCVLLNRVTTSNGRIYDYSVRLRIRTH